MSDEEEYRSRSAGRREVRARIDERRQILERYIKLPDHRVTPIEVSGEVEDSLALLRRLKASGARARVVKHLSRRASDEEWEAIRTLVDGSVAETAARAAYDQEMVDWRAEILDASSGALETLRTDYPHADHQRLRQLVLQARRNPESAPAKGARKKLMKFLRALRPAAD